VLVVPHPACAQPLVIATGMPLDAGAEVASNSLICLEIGERAVERAAGIPESDGACRPAFRREF